MQHPGERGLTLDGYADAKHLPVEFLQGLGLSEIRYLGAPAVRIPYVDHDGTEAATRFRVSLNGDDKFRWKKGDKPRLYRLALVRKAREAGYVLLVEGGVRLPDALASRDLGSARNRVPLGAGDGGRA